MSDSNLATPAAANSAAAGVVPTPPAKISGLVLIALLGWLASASLFWNGLVDVATLVNPQANALGNFLFTSLAALALLPGIPLYKAANGIRKRAKAVAQGDSSEARHVASVSREHALVTLGFSAGILITGGLLWFVTTNEATIATTFLNPEFIKDSWSGILSAFVINVQVALGAEVIVLVFGLVIAIMRMLPGRAGRPLRWMATIYVDVFRAIPSIIVIYLVGFGLALAQVPFFKDLSPVVLAILALSLTYTGYVAEVYRAGLESIHPSQWAAARSLGLSYSSTLRSIIIPQAFRRMVPPLLNDFIGLQKDTALIGIMGVIDAFMQARIYSSASFNLSPVMVVAILFVLITIPQARFVDSLISKDQRRQKAMEN
jgi:polar amino acid transport system permease protein